METPINPSENQSTYFVNPEEAEETARLLLQDRLVTKEMGGVFPENIDLSRVLWCWIWPVALEGGLVM
ncbi:MAG TPA: hypothetical protein VGL94_06325 [Ktedonobacteraceae bacterium]